MKCLRNVVLLSTLALSPMATAADTYLTLGYGMAQWSDIKDDDMGLSTQVGLDFGINDWLSVEAAYYYFGETKQLEIRPVKNVYPNPQPNFNDPANTKPEFTNRQFRTVSRGNSMAISAIGRLGLSDSFNLMAKLGIEKWEISGTEQSVLGILPGPEEDGFAPLLGFGISYALSGQVHLALWSDIHSFKGDFIEHTIVSSNLRLYFRF